MEAGLAINPHTPVSLLLNILNEVDLICVMSVNPDLVVKNSLKHYNKIKELKYLRENQEIIF